MNNTFSFEKFMGSGMGEGMDRGGMSGISGDGIGGEMGRGGMGGIGGNGIGGGLGFRRGGGGMDGMTRPMYYHHPKPRYNYNYPYNYNNNYFYNNYYNQEDICFCTETSYDNTYQQKVCIDKVCGVCSPRSLCKSCHENITCSTQNFSI